MPAPRAIGRMATLSADERDKLDASDFAVPDDRAYPIHDEKHVRAALSQFPKGLDPDDRASAAKRIASAAKKFGIDVSDASNVAKAAKSSMSECTSLLALEFAEQSNLSEHRVPFLVTGHWEFGSEGGIGDLDVSRDDLQTVKRYFDENARRQDLPVVNEDHDTSRAIGWITSLEFADDDRLDAVVEFNPVGDTLLATDQYRYVSPELMRDWPDAELGTSYPLVAAGLAVTNKPRLKSLGRIAASEPTGAPSAAVLAMSEGPIRGTTPVATRRLLMGEACAHCSGTGLAHDNPPTPTEGNPMPETSEQPKAETPAAVTTPAASDAANLSETSAILAAETAKRRELETTVARLSEQVRAAEEAVRKQETAAKLATTNDRLDRLARDGKITPAERESFSERIVALSEGGDAVELLFTTLDARKPVVELSEKGSGAPETSTDESERINKRALTLLSERGQKQSDRVAYRNALLDAAREAR